MKAGNDESSNLSVWNDATISHCLNILMASFETTSVCLTVSSFLLATNPTAQDKLCAELDRYWLKKPVSTMRNWLKGHLIEFNFYIYIYILGCISC